MRPVFILTAFLTLTVFMVHGQAYDSIKVLNELNDETFTCKYNREKIVQLTKYDSLNNCIITKMYKTDRKDIYYIKEFNLYGQIREEGFGFAVWNKRTFLGIKLKPKTFYLQKDGNWKFYDNKGNKISDCGYKGNKIYKDCEWREYDEKGNLTKSYLIDH